MANGKLEGRITVAGGGGGSITVTETGGGGGSDTVTVPAATYYHSTAGSGSNDLPAEIAAQLNASGSLNATYTVTVSAGLDGTGRYTFTASGGSVTAIAISFPSTDLRDVIGFDGNVSGALVHTGQYHARSLWLPDCPPQLLNGGDSNWAGVDRADFSSTVSGAGHVYAISGQRAEINDITWEAVSRAKTWVVDETRQGASFQQFWRDVIFGGAAWSKNPAGPVKWYPDEDVDGTSTTYKIADGKQFEPGQLRRHWTGRWAISVNRMYVVPS